jgi:hypothetical protein
MAASGNPKDRQQRKVQRAKTKNLVAQAKGYSSFKDQKDSKTSRDMSVSVNSPIGLGVSVSLGKKNVSRDVPLPATRDSELKRTPF